MKSYTFPIISLAIFASCHNTIKHDDKPAVDSKTKNNDTINAIAPPIPNANNEKTVNKPEDLVGYWVGMFEPDFPNDYENSKHGVGYGEVGYWNRNNKINVSIDSIEGEKIIGHSIDAGIETPFTGNFKFVGNKFNLELKEPGTGKYDGIFTMGILKNDSLLNGNWTAFGKIEIPNRKFILQKKNYFYNINLELIGYKKFADWEKHFKENREQEGEKYIADLVFATTEDVLKFNASKQLLTPKDIENLKQGDLYIIRNSIYAKHGYSFKNRPLRAFFDAQDWYIPITADIKKDLTDLEKKNIELLLRYEKNAKAYYDTFGRG